ncbi:MAG: hypothetical protein HYR72_16440 [Deltaproteobacteria bacterium]|nr:hypothetical protein [Deltaproteobacteria bacterium]MBI3389545.1 hypothetical protein [Deltaproteobacteria bacterium]
MNKLLQLAQANPGKAIGVAAVVVVGLYFLLNRKSAATRDAEERIAQLRDQGRDKYTGQRPLK